MTERAASSLVIVTGMSGSGKHTAIKALEDLGYHCVDNLPTALIPRLIDMTRVSGGKIDKLAVVVDVRSGESLSGFERLFQDLRMTQIPFTSVFLDASDEVLARRYSETRRAHPLARDCTLLEGVQAERRRLRPVRELSDRIIDTSKFSVHDLRNFVYESFRDTEASTDLKVTIMSFGFKHGIPFNSDLVFDVRFLPNPHFVPHLREQVGTDPEIVRFMEEAPETEETLERLEDLLEYLLPRYRREGKSYLTAAIGCTGGRHRSVMMTGALCERLKKEGFDVRALHRDIHRK